MAGPGAEEQRTRLPPAGHSGLTTLEARALLSTVGDNSLVPEKAHGALWGSLFRALKDPMAVMLLVAAPTYVLLGDSFDAVVTALALVPVLGISLLLEGRAERALEKLSELTAPTARVFRDGELTEIVASEIVPGDLVLLQEGDVTPADMVLVHGTQLSADESALTGESLPVDKALHEGDGSVESAHRVLAGTTIVAGRGVCRVTHTGPRTEYGKIGTLVSKVTETRTPLQRSVDALFQRLALGAAVVCVAVFGIQLAYGRRFGEALISGVSLAIAAIPEEFPMVFTLFLTLGAFRLTKERALVRRLAGVETLGSTTVICTDKTGTLSLGRLDVGATATLATGTRLASDAAPADEATLSLLEAAVLASEPDPFDGLERAIVKQASALGVDVAGLHRGKLLVDYPFDPRRKVVTHVWQHGGQLTVSAKGSLEGMLEVTRAPADVQDRAHQINRELAERGMRLIAVARGTLAEATRRRADDEATLSLLGLVAFVDPLRPGVFEAMRACESAGIRVVMITGDHPLTAHAVADALGIAHDDGNPVVTGDELDAMDEATLRATVAKATLFSRTRPEQKYRLVTALQANGEVVAMTGDGINDAPALRKADIGVAMGLRGTAVAREASTLVLLDDNFATIVQAVSEGRRIFDNLRRSFAYLIAFHVPIVLLALIAPVANVPLLLLPIELVVLELVVHPTASLVFEGDPPPADLMRRKPRAKGEPLISFRQAIRPALVGLTLTFGVLFLYLELLPRGTEESARGAAFASLLFGQLLLVFTERSPEVSVLRAPYAKNLMLPVISTLTVFSTLALVSFPPLARVMHVAPPSWSELALAAVVAAASTLWSEPFKRRIAAWKGAAREC